MPEAETVSIWRTLRVAAETEGISPANVMPPMAKTAALLHLMCRIVSCEPHVVNQLDPLYSWLSVYAVSDALLFLSPASRKAGMPSDQFAMGALLAGVPSTAVLGGVAASLVADVFVEKDPGVAISCESDDA
jgi:hypothetical protein